MLRVLQSVSSYLVRNLPAGALAPVIGRAEQERALETLPRTGDDGREDSDKISFGLHDQADMPSHDVDIQAVVPVLRFVLAAQ